MASGILASVDFVAAVFTCLFLAKLLFQAVGTNQMPTFACFAPRKRCLLNQQVQSRTCRPA